MIDVIRIENFKGLKQVEVAFGSVTVLIGPNGSGKSSVLQALALLKQSLGTPSLVLNGPEIQLGEWSDIVHGGALDSEVVFGIRGRSSVFPSEQYVYTLRFNRGQPINVRATAGAKGVALDGTWVPAGPNLPGEIRVGEKSVIRYSVGNAIGYPFSYAGGQTGGQEQAAFDVAARDFSELVKKINEGIARDISLLSFVGPLRGITRPAYPLADRTFEEFVSVYGAGEPPMRLLSTLGYKVDLVREISAMVRELFGHDVEFALVPPQHTSLRSVFEGFTTNVVNDGTAVNQLLFVLSQFAVLPTLGMIAIEEPEIHLHPRLQRRLVDLLVNKAIKGNKRLLLTTHSEHVLLSVLAKVLKRELSPDEFALYQFSHREGRVQIERSQLSSDGTLTPPLREFFETNMGELLELLRAVAGEPK